MHGSAEAVAKIVSAEERLDRRGMLREFMRRSGLSTQGLATACGIYNDEFLKRWLDGDRAMDAEYTPMIERFLGLDGDWMPIAFDNLQMVWNLCRHAERRGRWEAVQGRSGYGKTTALKLFARTTGAIYYEYDEVSGARDVVKNLCRRAGVTNIKSASLGEMHAKLVQTMRQRRRTIIIDQADTLPFRAVEAVRAVFDQVGCPMIFGGLEPRLRDRLERRNVHENAEQLQRRITSLLTLPPPTPDDIKAICDRFGVHGQRAIAFVHKRAVIGGYGTAKTLCEDALDVQDENKKRGNQVTMLECLMKAATYLVTVRPGEETQEGV